MTRTLNPGHAVGEVMILDEPLSFWGGFDPVGGTILDNTHPQFGRSVSGKILVTQRSRGSAGTPAGVAEGIRSRTGPSAVILREADVNITVGAQVAAALYGIDVPVLVADQNVCDGFADGERISIDAEDRNIQIKKGA